MFLILVKNNLKTTLQKRYNSAIVYFILRGIKIHDTQNTFQSDFPMIYAYAFL